jgi:glycosyltransferase involved in cell wall biosynthesis
VYPALLPAVLILILGLVRIALFTEQDPVTPCGTATTIAALIGHSPSDIQIIDYRRGSDRFSGLRADQILQRAKRDRIDLIHLATRGPLAIVALFVAWRLNIPVVGSLSPDVASTPLCRKYLGVLSKKCECVFASSSAEHERLSAAGVEPSKIAIVRTGVDADRFAPSKRSAALRERWQVSDSRPAVIYVGALSEAKSSRRLLSLEMGLLRSHPMHRLIVVGDGPGREELEQRCAHAVFMGWRPHHEIPEVLASADLFVCPSELCSTDHAVLEAQASGLPALVMQRGSASERMSQYSGCVCRSTVDLIVETAALVRNDVRRKGMGRAAREHALQLGVDAAIAPLYAEYRAAAADSGVGRELRPALVSQGRRL